MKQEGKGKKWSDPFFSACHWKEIGRASCRERV